MGKCNVCRQPYSANCDYRQGRCPLHPPLIDIEKLKIYNFFKQIFARFKQ